MGRHDEAMKLLDNSKFVKLGASVRPRLRILTDPYVSNRVYPSSPDVKTVFTWAVYEYATQRVKILEKGKSLKDQLDTVEEIYGFSLPSKFDIVITTTGEGQQSKYRVDGILPVAAPLPGKAELDNMIFDLNIPKVSGGIPIDQVRADNIPAIQQVEAKAGGDDNRPPSQSQYAAARAAEAAAIAAPAQVRLANPAPSDDAVLDDIPEGEINLDDIPDSETATADLERPDILK